MGSKLVLCGKFQTSTHLLQLAPVGTVSLTKLVGDPGGPFQYALVGVSQPPPSNVSVAQSTEGVRWAVNPANVDLDAYVNWMNCTLACDGPKGHIGCNLMHSSAAPSIALNLIEHLQIDCDLFGSVRYVCRGHSISKWYSTSTNWEWAGCAGSPLCADWTSLRAWVCPEAWDDVLLSKLGSIKPGHHERELEAVVLVMARTTYHEDVTAAGAFHLGRCLSLQLPPESQRDVATTCEGGWNLYFHSNGAIDQGPWRFALNLFKKERKWVPSSTLVRRVLAFDRLDKWRRDSIERERRSLAQDKIASAVAELQGAVNAAEKDRKRMNLFKVLSVELAIRGTETDVEDLLLIASQNLGPPEDWGTKRLEQIRDSINLPGPALRHDIGPDDWIKALEPSNLSFVPDGSSPSFLKSGVLIDAQTLDLTPPYQRFPLTIRDGLRFTLDENFLHGNLRTDRVDIFLDIGDSEFLLNAEPPGKSCQ